MENTDEIISNFFQSGTFTNIIQEHLENKENKEDSDSEPDIISSINTQTTKDLDIIVGIDLGTVNSCISVWRNNHLEIIPDEYGNLTIPSIVGFTNKSRYIGLDAKNQKELNPKNVFYEVKRLIGKKYNDSSVINDLEFLNYDIISSSNGEILIKSHLHDKKEFTPEYISSMILSIIVVS